jgi:hypothetical protein
MSDDKREIRELQHRNARHRAVVSALTVRVKYAVPLNAAETEMLKGLRDELEALEHELDEVDARLKALDPDFQP